MTDQKREITKIKKYLEEQEDRLTDSFSDLLQCTGEHGDLHSFCQKLLDALDTGETTWQHLYLQSLAQTTDHKKLFDVLLQLTAHFLMSLIKARENGNTAEAVENLSMARYHLGRLHGAFDSGLYTLNKKDNSPKLIPRKPKDRIEQIKNQVLKLLDCSVKMGDKADNLEEAFKLIRTDLQEFLTTHHFTTPNMDGIQRAVSRWRKTDTAFNNKFIQLIEKLRS